MQNASRPGSAASYQGPTGSSSKVKERDWFFAQRNAATSAASEESKSRGDCLAAGARTSLAPLTDAPTSRYAACGSGVGVGVDHDAAAAAASTARNASFMGGDYATMGAVTGRETMGYAEHEYMGGPKARLWSYLIMAIALVV